MRFIGRGRARGRAFLPLILSGVGLPALVFAEHSPARAETGVVVSVSPPASEAGVGTLRQGGNAVDAATTTALALAVAWPEAGALGGGGFMLIQPAGDAEPVAIDYRESAPSRATTALFVPEPGATDHRLVATPGALRGLWLAQRTYGRLPWEQTVAPAERLAREGFEIDAALAHSLNAALKETMGQAEFQRLYRRPSGGSWREGDRFVQTDLARSLATLAREGVEAFYSGPLARAIADEVAAGGGSLAADDLAGYVAKVREPAHGVYRGHDVYAAPAPSSGGVALVEMLNIIEPFELRAFERWSPFTVHLMTEAMRRAQDDAQRYLGDPEFDSIPLHLTSKQYARQIARQIDPRRAPGPGKQAGAWATGDEGGGSTHFCVVDPAGMAVANSYGLGQPFGSRVAPPGTGFVLNSSLTAFAAPSDRGSREARADRAASPRGPNALEPGKRMRSAANPILVRRDGRLRLVTGEAGNSSCSGAALCVLINMLEFGMDAGAALDAPRWRPSGPKRAIEFEGYGLEAYSGAVRGLQLMGHNIEKPPARLEAAHLIWLHDGLRQGAADQRVGGAALGD